MLRPVEEHPDYTVVEIRGAIAQQKQISDVELEENGRGKKVAFAQHLTMYLLQELRDDSVVVIGKACGGWTEQKGSFDPLKAVSPDRRP
jgi:chromosomal replication initiation ATPase DnaA